MHRNVEKEISFLFSSRTVVSRIKIEELHERSEASAYKVSFLGSPAKWTKLLSRVLHDGVSADRPIVAAGGS
jgi:hypothetical protein